jgi:hypothetical protein
MFKVKMHFKPLVLTAEGSNPTRAFGFLHVKKLSSYLTEMSVVLLRWPIVPEIMHGGEPEVFRHK